MKRAYLISLLYIPFAICAVTPNKDVSEKVDNAKAQLALDQAQDIVIEAISEQLNSMDKDKVMNDISSDLQKFLQNADLEEYSLDAQALQEYASRDLFGGLFGAKNSSDSKPEGGFSFNFTTGNQNTDNGSASGKPLLFGKLFDGPKLSIPSPGGFNISFQMGGSSENGSVNGSSTGLQLPSLFGNAGGSNGSLQLPNLFGNAGSSNGSLQLPNLFGNAGSANGSFQLPNLFGNAGSSNGSFQLPNLFGNAGSSNGSFQLPNLFGNVGGFNGSFQLPNLLGNGTAGAGGSFKLPNLFGNGAGTGGGFNFQFGSGSGLENLAGFSGSAIGNLFNMNANPLGGILADGFKNLGLDKIGDTVKNIFKGVGDKLTSFFTQPSDFDKLLVAPLVGGAANLIGNSLFNAFRGFNDFSFGIVPKFGAFGAHHLPGFLRLQTHEFLVDDLSNLKNIFLTAMRSQSPTAADEFESMFNKINEVLVYASSIHPSMNDVLVEPTEDNIRSAIMALSNVLSNLDTQ